MKLTLVDNSGVELHSNRIADNFAEKAGRVFARVLLAVSVLHGGLKLGGKLLG